jgi:hypothetical protein
MTVETIIIVIVFLLMCSAYSPTESHIGLNFFLNWENFWPLPRDPMCWL